MATRTEILCVALLSVLGCASPKHGVVGNCPVGEGADNESARSRDANLYGYLVKTDITWGALRHAPTWNPKKSDPPLSVRRAIQIATTHLQDSPAGSTKWEMGSVLIRSVTEDRWYYEVCFEYRGPNSEQPGTWRPVRIHVLMDGTVGTRIEKSKHSEQTPSGDRLKAPPPEE